MTARSAARPLVLADLATSKLETVEAINLGRILCLSSGQNRAEQNLNAALDEIATLRAGQPTALRVVTYPDPYVGTPTVAGDWGLTDTAKNVDAVVAMFDAARRWFNAMLCSVAKAHGGICVDVGDGARTPALARNESTRDDAKRFETHLPGRGRVTHPPRPGSSRATRSRSRWCVWRLACQASEST